MIARNALEHQRQLNAVTKLQLYGDFFDNDLPLDDLLEEVVYSRLGVRAASFRVLINELMHHENGLIIETGCLRRYGNWEGDGQSTFIFDTWARKYNGTVFSIDISMESIAAAREVCSSNTHTVLSDAPYAIADLAKFRPDVKVNLLYLDSMDLDQNNVGPSAEHHMYELAAALPLLGKGSLVCVDDYGVANGGKGRLVDRFMQTLRAPVVFEGYQKIWQMP